MRCGGRHKAAGPRLRPPLLVLVAGLGLAAWPGAHKAALPAGPVHPRRRLADISKVGGAYYAYKFHAYIFCIFFAYFGIYMQFR